MAYEPDMVELLVASLVPLWHGAALVDVARSRRAFSSKFWWSVAILVLVPFGLVAWHLRGRERGRKRYLGLTGYLSIGMFSTALLLGLTRELWVGLEYPAWIAAWSIVTFFMYAYDKLAGEQGKDEGGSSKAARINENALHLFAVIGGFPGAWLGRHALRHKTRYLRFGVVLLLATAAHASKLLGLW